MTTKDKKSQLRVFINYRRSDTGQVAPRLKKDLATTIGDDRIFYDRENLSGGDLWKKRLEETIKGCSVFLVLIGKEWLHARNELSGQRRLDEPADLVRTEIEFALKASSSSGLLIIPVLVDDAHMPEQDHLPASIRSLSDHNASALRTATNAEWDHDLEKLLACVRQKGLIRQDPTTESLSPCLQNQLKQFPISAAAPQLDRDARGREFPMLRVITPAGFSYSQPDWLNDTEREKLTDLAKAAFILLLLEQTESGCWSKTYLYRHRPEPLPVAHGALTGTPFALIALSSTALSSYEDEKNNTLQPLYQILFETLARIIRDDGSYLKRYTQVSAMGPGPEPEKPRHAAGACLCKLIYGVVDSRDLKTIENMISQTVGLQSYDQAVLSRLLLQVVQMDSVRQNLRRRSGKRLIELLGLLATTGQRSSAAYTWAQESDLQHDSKNQWGTVWWILPSLIAPQIPVPLKDTLSDRLIQFLLAQSAAEPTGNKLLATEIDQSGRGQGNCVFGTGVALVAWRLLENEKLGNKNQATAQAKRMVNRIVSCPVDAIESPSLNEPPHILEGYLGWAAICLAAASVGIQLSREECRTAVSLSRELNNGVIDNRSDSELESLIESKHFVSPQLASPIARVAVRIGAQYTAVPKWQGGRVDART